MVEMGPLEQLIDGVWSPAPVELGTALEDPSTGATLDRQRASDPVAVETALAAAEREHRGGRWAATTVDERADVLLAIADAVEPVLDRIADLEALSTGVIRRTTGMLGAITAGAFRLAAQQLRDGVLLDARLPGPTGRAVEVCRHPLGPAVCLVPWNAPAPMTSHKVASALAAGCPVIVKPTEWAPHGSTELSRAIAATLSAHGFGGGVFQVVQGAADVGAALVADARVHAVSFTGGTVGGVAIATAVAGQLKPAQLELGGNNPLLVMPDAPAESVAQAICDLLTTLNGQWCRALGRLLLPAPRAGELLDAALDRLAKVRLGSAFDPDSDMGPIVHSRHLHGLHEKIDALRAAGGTVHSAADRGEVEGNFLAPTLVTGVGSAAAQQEIFGPVATVHCYDDIDGAVALANGTAYGLEGYVVGADEDAALAVARRIRAGGVKVNGTSMLSLHLMAPRPAWGLSGLAVEGTRETIEFFTGQRVVGVEGSLPGLS